MTQEEKELLLKDLCARLPYGVRCTFLEEMPKWFVSRYGGDENFKTDFVLSYENFYLAIKGISMIRPYLRPMSSMTEEEFKEVTEIDRKRMIFSARHLTWHIDGEVIDFFNRKMLDWRGLIPMGLALEAPEDMYTVNILN